MGAWLTYNPDCAGQVGHVAVAWNANRLPPVLMKLGVVETLTDAADVFIGCADPDPTDNTPTGQENGEVAAPTSTEE
jgi:hypothetical protein